MKFEEFINSLSETKDESDKVNLSDVAAHLKAGNGNPANILLEFIKRNTIMVENIGDSLVVIADDGNGGFLPYAVLLKSEDIPTVITAIIAKYTNPAKD